MGEDTAASSMVSDAQVLRFLNEAQRKLSFESDILLSCWTASTVASQEQYSVPSDWSKVRAVFLYRTTSDSTKIRLRHIRMEQRDPSKQTGVPDKYYVWGINVSGANSFYIGLNPIPSASGTSDIEMYGRQLPLDMVSGGQAPEVMYQWQDALSTYGAMRCFERAGREWRGQKMDCAAEWADWVAKAQAFSRPISADSPTQLDDTAGYLSWQNA